MKPIKSVIIILLCGYLSTSYSQISNKDLLGQYNAFKPAVPFLLLSPSAEIGGLANVQSIYGQSGITGVFGNPGMLSFSSSAFGISASYMPWIRELVPDVNYYSLGGFYRISNKHVIGLNGVFLKFNVIQFINAPEPFTPIELAPSISYSYKVNESMSVGIRAKFIYSDLVPESIGGVNTRPGQSIALDFGINKQFQCEGSRNSHQIGVFLQNVGSKISYSKDSDQDFIPINLRVGYRYNFDITDKSNVFAVYEMEKLLIPSPPIYYPDSVSPYNDPIVEFGFDPNVSVPVGMIRSFYDAPDGLSEELHEIIHHFGAGLKLNYLSLVGGYYSQHSTKGNTKYFSFGIGLSSHGFEANFCYLLPLKSNSYLNNTYQVSVGFQIE